MLLLQATKQQVWLKAASDSSALKNFFYENKIKYAISDDSSYQDVIDAVQSDYQELLMNQWVNELRCSYRIIVNEEALSSLL